MNKNFNPKVSIIIPVYNGSNYLREAIDSALAQTYKNLEILVINDGSDDGGKTDEICKHYGDRIRYFVKENGGVATALNKGIEEMEGEYFSWLSHDDKYLSLKIEKQIEFLSTQKNKEIVLYMDYDLIDSKSEVISHGSLDHGMLMKKPEYALLRGSVNGITLLIPKKAFTDYGYFDSELKCTQDYDMWRRISKSYNFIHLPLSLTQTRIHPLQDSNKHPNVRKEGNPLWISMMEDLPKKNKERLEGTEFNFYYQMARFLKGTPYSGAFEFAKERVSQIKENSKALSSKKLISVIIPFYNRIELLKSSIDSVLQQTHRKWELILVNDCSTQNISEIEEYIKLDKRITIINLNKNGGAAKARNIGIQKAKGEYIAFLDSDDQFLPNKLENQVAEMFLSGYKVSHTSYLRKEGKLRKNMFSGELTGNAIPSIIASCPIATPTVMVERKFLIDNSFSFPEEFQIGEDVCFWLEILREQPLLGIEEVYTIVNVNKGSAINNVEKQITGIGNILKYVLSDSQFSKYYREVGHLCRVYYELAGGLISPVGISEKLEFSNPISKLIYLFKSQGFFLTIKKVVWKYVPKGANKIKNIVKVKK